MIKVIKEKKMIEIKPKPLNKKVTAFSLSPEVIDELEVIAKKNKVSKSWVVESILKEYFISKNENPKRYYLNSRNLF